ncbi:MAG: DUF2007 domain-containing protein [Gammaproteobacteria bacterium]
MKKIYSSEDSMMTGHIKSLLEIEGIACLVRNQNLSSALGELPPIECWPEIWVSNDDDYRQAMKIVNAALSPAYPDLNSWNCVCGEQIEGQFSACWNCGQQRPD